MPGGCAWGQVGDSTQSAFTANRRRTILHLGRELRLGAYHAYELTWAERP